MIETEKRVREAVRYLGFGRNEADERTLELIQQSFKDLEQEAGPKSICQIFDLNHTEDGRLVTLRHITFNFRERIDYFFRDVRCNDRTNPYCLCRFRWYHDNHSANRDV